MLRVGLSALCVAAIVGVGCGSDATSDAANDPWPGNGAGADAGASADGATGKDARAADTGGGASDDDAADDDADPGDSAVASDAFTPGDATKLLPAPPATWKEHWFEHVQLLKLIDYNDDIAVYYDDDVNHSDAAWETQFMTNVWRYARATYGEMKGASSDGRLYTIFHTNKYGGGHPAYYYDGSHDFRNTTDCGPGPWVESDDYAHDEPSHEAGHVVESTASGKHGSPAFTLWGDSKWMEFFQYDLYLGLGMNDHAQRVFTKFTNTSDTFPRANTHWFRDWFYPLWRDHGHAQAMVNFFKLLAKYFPANANGDYSRDMTWGEFVHFMSGAAHADLLSQARTAFGPDFPKDAELAQAKQAFPQITY